MGTIADKLSYLNNAVDDIQQAIIEKGVAVDSSVPLADYGAKIREIETGGGDGWFGDYRSIDTADFAITEDDVVAADVADISDTISFTEKKYTEL